MNELSEVNTRSTYGMLANACVDTFAPEIPEHPTTRMLWDRKGAANQLSISLRSLDYLIAGKKLNTRRIGKKVLIPHGELVRFSRKDHLEAIN